MTLKTVFILYLMNYNAERQMISVALQWYVSTLFTAQQVQEVNILIAGACCDKVNGKFNVVAFREKFEEFRQRHLPYSECFSLRLIAEGLLVEERAIDICLLILKDFNKNPEKELWKK